MVEAANVFAGHGDHRIFMSLVLLALACDRPCTFSGGTDAAAFFPGFAGLGLADRGAPTDIDNVRPLSMSA